MEFNSHKNQLTKSSKDYIFVNSYVRAGYKICSAYEAAATQDQLYSVTE